MTIENADETLDTAALVAEISSDLFGQGEEEDGAEKLAGEQRGDDPSLDTSVVAPQQIENSEEVKALGAPDTWTKESIAKWATLDPVVQAEVLKREEDMHKGLDGYKSRAEYGDKFQQAFQPFEGMPGWEQVDPVQLTQAFLSNHVVLMAGTPEQKVNTVKMLVDAYKIDVPAIAQALGLTVDPGFVPPTVDPKIAILEAQIAELRNGFGSIEKTRLTQAKADVDSRINAFASTLDSAGNPAYPHFDKVIQPMAGLIKAGLVPAGPDQLAKAYDMAVHADPTLRQIEFDRLTADRVTSAQTAERERVAAANRAKGINVDTTQKNRDGAVPKGSWEDTLTETAAAIASRH